jgi:Tol biopolymer transport system component/tRNA A-37 threonylcarbamoyl transferase component Bud32
MPLTPGVRVGTFEILAPIGHGGMGEVWRARDGKLHRDVAIKALPEDLREDPDRLTRFEREARMLAALNHPNIASIYGLEEKDGSAYLVMELVEGPTLAERLAAGALPFDEALAVARDIAIGLEAAHQAGIIHRDLKPANVKLRQDGSVKILDLGLARTIESSGRVDSSLSPTQTTPATHAGVILGTAAYMSPEQARGRPLDKRSDIFSFGCVLYECLTGKQAFHGETVSDTLASILKSEPDWSALPAETPGRVRSLLRRCLEKDPKRRLHDVADARLEIEDAVGGPADLALPAAPAPTAHGNLGWVLVGALAGAALVAAIWLLRRPAARPEREFLTVRAALPLAAGDQLWTLRPSVAISPDGRTLVFAAMRAGVLRLFRRTISGADAEPIAGTEGGSRPFFSPDGEWVGFVTRNQLRKVPISGGNSVLLGNVPPITAAASWGTDKRMVFTLGANSSLHTVADTGGAMAPLTRLDAARGEHAHLYPQVLPGGRGILFTQRLGRDFADVENSNIAVLETATGKRRTVLEGASFARYGGGRLVFLRGSSLFSAPFDLASLAVSGPPVPLAEPVAVEPGEGIAQFALSEDGTLAFIDGGPIATSTTTVLRLDRQGKETAVPLPEGNYFFPRLSPDGRRLALIRFGPLRSTLLIYSRDRQILSTLTPEPGRFFCPVWSPDGKRLAFSRMGDARPFVCVKSADASGEIQALSRSSADAELPSSWSPDGKTIAYTTNYTEDRSPTRRGLTSDIWLAAADGSSPLHPWFETPFRESGPVFSPEGRWLTYVSDESGTPEIYIRAYPGPGPPIKVSTETGFEPTWSQGGRELIYRSGPKSEMFLSVEIRDQGGLAISPPRLLFTSDVNVGGQWSTGFQDTAFRDYDVSADGNEFFATRTNRGVEPPRQLRIVTNWAGSVGK